MLVFARNHQCNTYIYTYIYTQICLNKSNNTIVNINLYNTEYVYLAGISKASNWPLRPCVCAILSNSSISTFWLIWASWVIWVTWSIVDQLEPSPSHQTHLCRFSPGDQILGLGWSGTCIVFSTDMYIKDMFRRQISHCPPVNRLADRFRSTSSQTQFPVPIGVRMCKTSWV